MTIILVYVHVCLDSNGVMELKLGADLNEIDFKS